MKIVVKQVSGLGNQLSQYAAGLYYSKKYGASLEVIYEPEKNAVSHGFPRPFLLSKFCVEAACRPLSLKDRILMTNKGPLQRVATPIKRLSRTEVVNESFGRRYEFHKELPTDGARTLYLRGYWQSYRYPEAVESELRPQFGLRKPPAGKDLEVLERIRRAEVPVAVHIRRGDYTLAAEGNIALHMGYYEKAIRHFEEKFGNCTFFVFSDDMEFAKESLRTRSRAVFVDHNDSFSSHEDLRLMSSCAHNVIANSTFSWWAAWLNSNPEKIVVSPKHWLLTPDSYFPDLLPPAWILY